MSQSISPSTSKKYGLERVCKVWKYPRSTFYLKKKPGKKSPSPRGPKPIISKKQLLELIEKDIKDSPFTGEGHKKVHARLKRKGVVVGRNQVLKEMRKNKLLSPLRGRYRPPNKHDGKIITETPNDLWGTDGTKVQTVKDGNVWIFSVVEHWNTECLGWHVCKKGDRFAAYEPIKQAIERIYGSTGKDIAKGLKLRMDHGSQYTSDYFLNQLEYHGVENSFGLVRQPETNGVSERFHRTLKEQIMGRIFKNIDEVREVVRHFVKIYNEHWLVEKLGYKTPLEARREHYESKRVA